MSLVVSLSSPTAEEWSNENSREIHYTNGSLGWSECNRSVEPIGEEFELVWSKVKKGDVEIIGLVSATSDDKKSQDSNDDDNIDELKENYKNNHKEWTKTGKDVNHYKIMGLDHLRWRATDNDIKLAYKKMILVVHPDKNQDLGGNDEAFKALVKSNNILSDIKKRRAYDSTDPFDDDIPTADEEGDFFEIYEPVFDSNSRWSNVQPVPKLGDMDTPYDKVVKFYNFWWSFKSWRDFTFEDDHDLDNADSREEKRWMERENEKKRVKQRKIEAARIQDLANLAYKKDPRIQKKLKEEDDKKNAHKNAKNEAKRKAQEEKEAAEKAEKERVEAEEKRKKDEAEEKKRVKAEQTALLKKGKIQFRDICKSFQPPQKIEDVELVIATLDNLQLGELTKEMETKNNVTDKKAVFLVQLNEIQEKQREADRLYQEQRKALLNNKKEAKPERPWTEDELHLLAKAIQKFPPGVTKRWESVASCIPTRSLKDVIAKAKTSQPTQQQSFSKPEAAPSGSDYDKLKAKVGHMEIKSELSSKVDLGQYPVGTTSNGTESTTTATAPSTVDTAKPAAKKETTTTTASVEWTPEEQKLLEEALQKVDKNAEDRWDQIAARLGTKSKKDCVARFKYLATMVKNIQPTK
ncbi:myb domain-containing protein [Dictyostelium discoideum AX4]|uniref:Myb domain-containing protein n=1 Tax=Dictyostelium discoideum TaxID=44689 RepID=Q54YL9_DICDI|nr:myb domain-containing protein [Dictyostelium discoideum AX4]EAL68262.1 myb domain-containing protein [Dictyostelium discoideum AX4]|eukprot:XP_642183.1 myb domain-containing protein [Dictyostelium discoideum AX4]